MAAVGGCCGRAGCAAAEDADELGSATPIAAVGRCCPLAVLAAPEVGPAPASRAASTLARLSISVVQGPARAAENEKAARSPIPSANMRVFMAFSLVVIAERRARADSAFR